MRAIRPHEQPWRSRARLLAKSAALASWLLPCLRASATSTWPRTVLARHFQPAKGAPSARPASVTRFIMGPTLPPNLRSSASSIGSPAGDGGQAGRQVWEASAAAV